MLFRSLPDSATAAWKTGEPYGCRSHHDGLKGRLLRRLLTVQLVNAAKLAFARTRSRGVALGYFAFAFMLVERIGIAPIRLSACKANPGS